MRILPILYSPFKVQDNNKLHMISQKPSVKTYGAVSDSFKVSFRGEVVYPELDLSPLLQMSEVHCPVCGVKMLCESDYQKILKKADKVENTKDFIDLLYQNREFIPDSMNLILSGSGDSEYVEYTPLAYYIKSHLKGASNTHKSMIKLANDRLRNVAAQISPEKTIEIEEILKDVFPNEYYPSYLKKVLPFLKNLDISGNEKYQISKDIFPNVRATSDYYRACKIKNIESLKPNEIARQMCENIFKNSVIDKSKIVKSEQLSINSNNSTVICSKCNKESSKGMFYNSYSLHDPMFKTNIKRYLADVSKQMGAHNLDVNIPYINNFCYWIDTLSRHEISMSDAEIAKFYKCISMASRHDLFIPIVQREVDIPCAECGSVLIPHDVHLDILKSLESYNSPIGYRSVLKKYNKYIGYYAKDIINQYDLILKQNPHIGNEEFVSKLKSNVTNLCRNNILDQLDSFVDQSKSMKPHVLNRYRSSISMVNKRIYNYIKQGKFNDFNYNNMFDECFYDLKLDSDCPHCIYVLLKNIKKECYVAGLVSPSEKDALIDKDPLYTVVFNIFKSGIATADHLVPQYSGGAGDIDNLIGLCKPCNALKTRKSVVNWYHQNPSIKYNLKRQMEIIDKMAKDKQIEGYDDWAKTMSEQLYELTLHSFDVRNDFN